MELGTYWEHEDLSKELGNSRATCFFLFNGDSCNKLVNPFRDVSGS